MFLPRPLRHWAQLAVAFFCVQFLVRLILTITNYPGLLNGLDDLFDGFLWDLGTWTVISLPYALLSLFLGKGRLKRFFPPKVRNILTFGMVFFFTYVGVCELFFWDEFHSRFNFIAVDYLVYTNEVLKNLQESFPMGLITLGVIAVSLLITWGADKVRFREKETSPWMPAAALIMAPFLFHFVPGPWLETHEAKFQEDQLTRNGFYEFYRAFRSNRIDFRHFYAGVPDEVARRIYQQKRVPLSAPEPALSMVKPNVVVIVVESLGAKFIAPLGGQKETTPRLNALAEKSLFFENLYATGTRTVRGLEAITLSVPPTPGYAVVKRPEHKGLYSMGRTFAANGYDPLFVYGGNSFFDNMGSFFGGNHFSVVDRDDFTSAEVTFENAWGVCDEDLFLKAGKLAREHDKTKPFLLFMLTTSNHRPFTYPDGRIDIPSGTGRMGAVKYTDFAIGKFLDDARKEDWAKNTLFVVVADHSTEGRGQFELEMSDFHIPLWIYAPGKLAPKKVNRLMSQIDLLPSLIHLLGLKDDSPFMGQSIFNRNWTEERAFIGNYQYVGYYKERTLTTLGPNRVIKTFTYDPATKKQKDYLDEKFRDEAISFYQTATGVLDSGGFKAVP